MNVSDKPQEAIITVPGVKLGVINCQSISGKLDFVFDHIMEYQLDIVALAETWFSSEDSKNTHGYILHHSPRTSGRRGVEWVYW